MRLKMFGQLGLELIELRLETADDRDQRGDHPGHGLGDQHGRLKLLTA